MELLDEAPQKEKFKKNYQEQAKRGVKSLLLIF